MTKKERAIEFIHVSASLHPVRVIILTPQTALPHIMLEEFIKPLLKKNKRYSFSKEGARWVVRHPVSGARIHLESTRGKPSSAHRFKGHRYDIVVLHDYFRFHPEFRDTMRAINGFSGALTKELKENMGNLNRILPQIFGENIPAFIQL